MTIAAGFHCMDGIIMCSDSQEIVDDIIKRSQSKLEFRPGYIGRDTKGPRAIFASAGDGDLADNLIQKLWGVMEHSDSLDAMIDAAEKELRRVYTDLTGCYHAGYMPTVELMMALWAPPDQLELIKIYGATLSREVMFHSIGCGRVLSTYLLNRLVHWKVGFADMVPAALYIVDEAKTHVHGCGGDTHLMTLTPDGRLDELERHVIESKTGDIRKIDQIAREIAALVMTQDATAESFESAVNKYVKSLREIKLSSSH